MRILAIESSCDETAVAVIEGDTRPRLLVNRIASQIDLHRQTGGIVPEVAARAQLEAILPLLDSVSNYQPFDLVAVTAGPGLVGSLLVGVETAKTLGKLWSTPVWGINHLEGHFYSALAGLAPAEIKWPVLALIVSGGHTELIISSRPFHYRVVGRTRDDAAGECLDKVARLLGLGYPGGPAIAAAALKGDRPVSPPIVPLPRPMLTAANLDFSFAGLKTAVYYRVRGRRVSRAEQYALARETQDAVVEVLFGKTKQAAARWQPRTVILVGGVAANRKLRQAFRSFMDSDTTVLIPPSDLTTDNAGMIALAAWFRTAASRPPTRRVRACPRWLMATNSY